MEPEPEQTSWAGQFTTFIPGRDVLYSQPLQLYVRGGGRKGPGAAAMTANPLGGDLSHVLSFEYITDYDTWQQHIRGYLEVFLE